MRKKYIISLLFIFTLLFSCYEDKGNYDYNSINRIEIEELKAEAGWTGVSNDTLIVKPVLKFEDGTIDESHLTYEWKIYIYDGPTIKREGWNKRDFYWIADTVITIADLRFTVTDTRNGMKYYPSTTFSVKVKEEFDVNYGVLVLAEKDGNSQLSLLSFDLNPYAENGVDFKGVQIYQNVYEERQGEVLGQRPIAIEEHYVRANASADNSQYLILQESGPVDVLASTMKKDVDMKQTFVGGEYPPYVNYFKESNFMSIADILVDQEGRLYTRIKLTTELFHSSYFFPEPVKFENKELKNCNLLPGNYFKVPFTLVHDKDNKRLLAVFDGGIGNSDSDLESAGKIVAVPGTPSSGGDIPEGFIPFNNFGEYELVDALCAYANYSDLIYSFIFKNNAGEYFLQKAYFGIVYNTTNIVISDVTMAKIDLPGKPTYMYATPYSQSDVEDIYFAVDNKLYRFDQRNPSFGVNLRYTFDANIVSVHAECYYNRWGVIALDNGKIYLFDVLRAKDKNHPFIIYKSPDDINYGKIVDAKLRTGGDNW